MRRLPVAAALAGTALSFFLAGSARPTNEKGKDGQATVRFGVEVNLVEAYAIVTDRDGRIVSDLRPEDFEIYEDGKLQQISSFTLVDVPIEPPKQVQFTEEIEPEIQTNAQLTEGRVFVVVLDDLHTAPERSLRVKEAANEFFERHMGGNDIAAVVHTSGKKDTAQEFTSRKELLKRSVDAFNGSKLRSATLAMLDEQVWQRHRTLWDPLANERVQRARNSLRTLERLAGMLVDVRGRRKAIVYFGEGIQYDIYGGIDSGNTMLGPAPGRDAVRGATRDAIRAATRANVVLYTIDPRGLGGSVDDDTSFVAVYDDDQGPRQIAAPNIQSALRSELHLSQENLSELAEETGGFALLNQNDFGPGLERLVKENSLYYLFGYIPTNDKQDGRYRKIDVRVKRDGLEVRSRAGYMAPKKGELDKKLADVEAPEGASPELARLTQSPLPLPGIPMRAVSTHFRVADDKAVVPLVVEMDISGFAFEEREGKLHDSVEFSAVATDRRGKVLGSVHSDFELAVRPATHQLLTEAGFRVVTTLELPPGRHHIRMAALESGAGKGGTLFYDVEIPEYGESELIMTPLVVTSGVESLIPVIGEQEDKEKAIVLPATRRRFARSDTLTVLAEVYPRVRSGSAAPVVDIATTLETTDGRRVFNRTEERGGDELEAPGTGIVSQVDISLSGLAPGEYLVEMSALSSAHQDRVSRRARIEIF